MLKPVLLKRAKVFFGLLTISIPAASIILSLVNMQLVLIEERFKFQLPDWVFTVQVCLLPTTYFFLSFLEIRNYRIVIAFLLNLLISVVLFMCYGAVIFSIVDWNFFGHQKKSTDYSFWERMGFINWFLFLIFFANYKIDKYFLKKAKRAALNKRNNYSESLQSSNT